MNRRQAADVDRWAAEDAAAADVCLLCGARTPTFADPDVEDGLAVFDLCGRCNSTFRELAQALAAAQERREARRELVDHVAGQLELDDVGSLVCACCGETSANDYLANLNHAMGADGLCASRRLRIAQGRA